MHAHNAHTWKEELTSLRAACTSRPKGSAAGVGRGAWEALLCLIGAATSSAAGSAALGPTDSAERPRTACGFASFQQICSAANLMAWARAW